MVKITHSLPQFTPFFNRFRDLFSLAMFRYFSVYINSLVVLPEHQKTVNQISRSWVPDVNRSSLQRFLSEVHWDFTKVIRRARKQLLNRFSHLKKHQRQMTLVIDDTTLHKFGENVFGVGWYRKNKKERATLGVQVVVLGVLIGNWLVPLDFRIYVQECVCKYIPMQFESKLQQARSMVKNLKLPHGFQVDVMFDAWYLNALVTGMIEQRGFDWYGRVALNRSVLWDEQESYQKLSEYFENRDVEWQELDYPSTRRHPAVVGHQRMGRLKSIGRVKFVISSLDKKGERKRAFFATNNPHTPMINILLKYEKRWKIEVFFQEARKWLGLEHWYFRDIASVVHHLCLVIVSAIACAWLRCENWSEVEKDVSWGEFIAQLQTQNQRMTLEWSLERWERDKSMTFEDLCKIIGL